jgi:hypothetical protein
MVSVIFELYQHKNIYKILILTYIYIFLIIPKIE